MTQVHSGVRRELQVEFSGYSFILTPGWWMEDEQRRRQYYEEVMHRNGPCPIDPPPSVIRDIISKHMRSSCMWVIIPLQVHHYVYVCEPMYNLATGLFGDGAVTAG